MWTSDSSENEVYVAGTHHLQMEGPTWPHIDGGAKKVTGCKYWYKKAYRNAVNDKELQSEILKEIELIKI